MCKPDLFVGSPRFRIVISRDLWYYAYNNKVLKCRRARSVLVSVPRGSDRIQFKLTATNRWGGGGQFTRKKWTTLCQRPPQNFFTIFSIWKIGKLKIVGFFELMIQMVFKVNKFMFTITKPT